MAENEPKHTSYPTGKETSFDGALTLRPANYSIASIIEDGLQKPAIVLDMCGCGRPNCGSPRIIVMMASPQACQVVGMGLMESAARFNQPPPALNSNKPN